MPHQVICHANNDLLPSASQAILVPSVLWRMRRDLRPLPVTALPLCFLLGLSPYAYLPWASRDPKPGSWGDLTTWRGLARHIARAEYGTFRVRDGGVS
jgi:hypothetical protein